MMALSLLKTKLYAPPLRPDMIRRQRLLQKLDDGLAFSRCLTLVSAPAGYGKTTLVREWLNDIGRPFAWFSLDESDNDPTRFINYLVAALQTAAGTVGRAALSLLGLQNLPPVEGLVTTLINDIYSVSTPFILVIDDYHLIHRNYIHESMQYLLDHLPPSAHLIIITREDPPLALPRFRVRGQLTEIRADDLRFTAEEAAVFFNQTMQLDINEEAISILGARTEGWAAGLQLAGLSLRGWRPERVNEFVKAFGGSHRYIIDYLVEEVLNRQDEEIREFLCQTSILNRLSAPLCDEVTGRDNSKTILAHLEQANLFLVPLDDNRRWFRYHHLFADFLRTELDQSSLAALHKKAAHWFARNGFLGEAVGHVLASGDAAEAGQMIEQAAEEAIQKAEARTLLRWLEALPVETVQSSGVLFSFLAYALLITGRLEEAAHCVEVSENMWTDSASARSRARLLGVKAWLANMREDPESVNIAQKALAMAGEADPFLRIFILLTLGQAQRKTGDMRASSQTFREALRIGQGLGFNSTVIGALVYLAFNLYIQGQLREVEQLCRRTIEECVDERGEPLPLLGMVYIPLGIICYERNELVEAREHLTKGLELCRRLALDRVMGGDCERTLTRIYFALGDTEAAFTAIQEARNDVDETIFPVVALRHDAVAADMRQKQGDLAPALHWAEQAGLSPTDTITILREQSYHVYARLLLAQKLYPDVQVLLANLEAFDRSGGCYGRLVNVKILQAITYHAQDQKEEAAQCMEQALQLAAPENWYRAFLDEGPVVVEVLAGLRHLAPVFIDRLLDEFRQSLPFSPQSLDHQGLSAKNKMVEPLSERELEIVALLAAGLSNAKIAEKLFITLGTAKWHINNIYSKLGVNSRTQAVARAQELKLIR